MPRTPVPDDAYEGRWERWEARALSLSSAVCDARLCPHTLIEELMNATHRRSTVMCLSSVCVRHQLVDEANRRIRSTLQSADGPLTEAERARVTAVDVTADFLVSYES